MPSDATQLGNNMTENNKKNLDINSLSVEFQTSNGWLRVIDDVSFHVKPGEIVGLVGESGSGKSVTSLATMGLITHSGGRISNGEIILNGRDLTQLSQRELAEVRGRDIAMIFQEPLRALNPSIRIGEQISEVIVRHRPGTSHSAAMKRAEEMLDLVQIPNARARMRDFSHQISGGMAQRVMIAMALACDPDFLIADEPTTALDATVQARVLRLIKEVQAEMELGVLMITHDLGVVAEVCDRAMIMYAGEVVEEGAVGDIFASPSHPYTSGLLGAIPTGNEKMKRLPFIPGTVPSPGTWPSGCRFSSRCSHAIAGRCDVEPVPLILDKNTSFPTAHRCLRSGELELPGVRKMEDDIFSKRAVADDQPDKRTLLSAHGAKHGSSVLSASPEPAHHEILVEAQNLTKTYVKTRNLLGRPKEVFRAVDDVSFDLRVGETLAIVGESGAGKSTMGRLVLGMEKTDTGSVKYQGRDLTSLSSRELRLWRRHAQMIFQDPYNSLNPRYSIGSAIREALDVHNISHPDDREDRVVELLSRVGIRPEHRNRYPHEFSGGQLQRVAIARAISTNPSMIVCDEPVAALDMSIRAQILNLLAELQEENNLSYIFVTHDLSLVRSIAHRVVVMRNGAVQEVSETEKLFSKPESEYTQSLINAIPNFRPGEGKLLEGLSFSVN